MTYLTTTIPQGVTFRRFIHGLIAGITGLNATLVRPMWQPNPPVVPSREVNWCAYGITSQRAEPGGIYHDQKDITGTPAQIVRHEQVDIICAFYGSECLGYAEVLRDGIEIAQNREALFLNGVGLNGFGDIIQAPELVNDVFFPRADVTMTLNREIRRTYNISHFVGAMGSILADDAKSQPLIKTFTVEE